MSCWLIGRDHLLSDVWLSLTISSQHKSDNEPVTKVLSHPTHIVPLSISTCQKSLTTNFKVQVSILRHLRWVGEYPLGEDEGKEEEPDLPAWCNKVGFNLKILSFFQQIDLRVPPRYFLKLSKSNKAALSNQFVGRKLRMINVRRWRKVALLWSVPLRSPNI